ncbi:MAG: hypothetical protein N2249_03595 [Melioribacter sp.]|nr:hypothetical protein [Melioribacter sp.]
MKTKIIILVLAYVTSFAQSKMNSREMLLEKELLIKKRISLVLEQSKLRKVVDSLKIFRNFLEEKLDKSNREIEELYVKKFGKVNGIRIYNKQVWKGMTEKMLLASWGKPDKIDKNIQKWGTFTQWYYGKVIFFFRDGKLIDFEESK